VFELFPILRDRLHARADILSGGQQQMLAIGQALMRRPRVLMLDEPSLGLAPIIVDQVLNVLVQLREGGTSILLVEQMVEQALEIADYGYVMQNGRIIGHGSAKSVQQSDLVQRAYLGVT
jgi:branched-chain amino acid transport system ATP-binding protein